MKLLAWNIRHGGAQNRALAPALLAHEPDVIVLGEYRNPGSASLIEQLRFFGYPHSVGSPVAGFNNGVAVVAREPFDAMPFPFAEPPFVWWGVEARLWAT